MGRRSTTTKKGVPRGVQKATKQIRREWSLSDSALGTFLRWLRIRRKAKFSVKTLLLYCAKLCLLPFEQLPSGNLYVLRPRKVLVLFYTYQALAFLLGFTRLVISGSLFLKDGVNFTSCLSMAQTLVSLGAWLIGYGSLNAQDLVNVLNDQRDLLRYYNHMLDWDWDIFDDMVVCVKLMATLGLIPVCTLMSALISAVTALPTSLRGIGQSVGLDTQSSGTGNIMWVLLFLPLEVMTVLGPLSTAAATGCISFMELCFMRVCGAKIREMTVVDMDSRSEVEFMYTCYVIHGNLARMWAKYTAASMLLTISVATIFATYIAFKHADMQIFVYLLYVIIAISFPVLLYISLYEGVQVGQLSQAIIWDLRRVDVDWMKDLSKSEKFALVKAAKAFRPLTVPSGDFTEFTYPLIWSTFDKIVNQIMFLFSL